MCDTAFKCSYMYKWVEKESYDSKDFVEYVVELLYPYPFDS